jgi:hypothetical protein
MVTRKPREEYLALKPVSHVRTPVQTHHHLFTLAAMTVIDHAYTR